MKLFASQGVTPPAEQVEALKSMKLMTATDGVANYMVTRTVIGSEANLEEPGNRVAFYKGAVNGLVQKERGTLLYCSTFKANGVEGVELSYKGVHKATGKLVVKYNRMLALEKMVYVLAVYPVDKNDSTGGQLKDQRIKFFSSIACQPSPSSNR